MRAASGREYLDFLSAAGSLNYGHNPPEIMSEVIAYLQGGGIVQSLDFHTDAKESFMAIFVERILQPRSLDYKLQFTGPTGSNAVEAALKLARKVTGRSGIAAFTNGYHGLSLGSLAATANPEKRMAAGVPLGNVTFLPYENFLGEAIDAATIVEEMLVRKGSGVDPPAAILLEMVQGEGGLSAATEEWMRRVAAVCRTTGSLLIVDDIQAGCGRTGTFFSFESSGVVPDIVVLSKSLSGFGTPLSMLLLRPEIDIWKPGEHNGTFRGNNLAFVGGASAIRRFWSGPEFAEVVQDNAQYLRQQLDRIACSFPNGAISVVGRGFMTGLSFEQGENAARAAAAMFERGIVVETCGPLNQVLKLLPPLTVSREELEIAIRALEDTVDELGDAGKGTPVV